MLFRSFQPVSFTGRDEGITDERRMAQRYTLSHLAHDVKKQTGLGEPVRDWFPISFMGTFTDWADMVHGPDTQWGNLTCGCHPNCGVGMALSLTRNYDSFQAPTHFKLSDLMKKFDKTFGATNKDYGKVSGDRTRADIDKRRADRWNFLFIAGMWFQDLFNYDFRRTERSEEQRLNSSHIQKSRMPSSA